MKSRINPMVSPQRAFDFQGSVPAFADPPIKYAGSKRWLVKLLTIRLHAHLSSTDSVYVEPFAGSLAMGLSLGWPKSFYADTNDDLVNLYRAAADPDALASEVEKISLCTGEKTYYKIRESVWPENRAMLSSAELAARTIWLNKNSFNGLHRYSQKNGHFNVPWGKRENVILPTREYIHRVSAALRGSTILKQDFATTLINVFRSCDPKQMVVYLDPPYGAKLKDVSTRGAKDRGGKSSGVFTGYTGTFTWADQVRLADWAKAMNQAGSLVIASNSWTDEVCDLYRDGFALFQVGVQHNVGATSDRRGRRAEMLAVSEGYANVLESIPAKVKRRK
jgi:DNA adenine methylase Dam